MSYIIYSKQASFPRKVRCMGSGWLPSDPQLCRVSHLSQPGHIPKLLQVSAPQEAAHSLYNQMKSGNVSGKSGSTDRAWHPAELNKCSSSVAPEGPGPSALVCWKRRAPTLPHCPFRGECPLLLHSAYNRLDRRICSNPTSSGSTSAQPRSPAALSLKKHSSFCGTAAGHHSSAFQRTQHFPLSSEFLLQHPPLFKILFI